MYLKLIYGSHVQKLGLKFRQESIEVCQAYQLPHNLIRESSQINNKTLDKIYNNVCFYHFHKCNQLTQAAKFYTKLKFYK